VWRRGNGGGAYEVLHPRESARPTKCRGSGAFLTCTPRTYCSRKWLPVKAFLPLPLQRSYFELLAVDLPGPTGISPSQSSSIRSQDGPSCRHRISASFWNLLGSRTISMRSVHRDFQRTNCLCLGGMAQTVPPSSATWSGPVRMFFSWRPGGLQGCPRSMLLWAVKP
jgi:hypothetical protein